MKVSDVKEEDFDSVEFFRVGGQVDGTNKPPASLVNVSVVVSVWFGSDSGKNNAS